MKPIFFMTIVAALLVAAGSCKSKSQKDAEKYTNEISKTMKENSPANTDGQQKANASSGTIPPGHGKYSGRMITGQNHCRP